MKNEPINVTVESRNSWPPDEHEELSGMLYLKVLPAIKEPLEASGCQVSGPIYIHIHAQKLFIYTITPPDGWPSIHFIVCMKVKSLSETYITFALDGEEGCGAGHACTDSVTLRWPIREDLILQTFFRLYDAMTKVAEVPIVDWSLPRIDQ